MTIITEAELRQMWQGGRGTIAPLPDNVRFTPSARDFINQWHIEIFYLDETAPVAVQTEATKANNLAPNNPARPAWDKSAQFPVNLTGPLPVNIARGRVASGRPGPMAQPDPKTNPRFLFRAKMDTLQAQFLLAIVQARRFNLPDLVDYLTTLAAYCREIASAEYNNRVTSPLQLAGLNEAEIHERAHWPDHSLDLNHVVPGPHDHEMLLQLNLLRCQIHETELVAANAFTKTDSQLTRPDWIRALVRLSNAIYYLALLFKAGKITWKMPGQGEQST